MAAVYGLFAGVFIYKELTFKSTMDIFAKAAVNTAMVLLIISASNAFSWLMARQGVAAFVGQWFTSVSDSPAIFLALVMLLLLFMGCFMETVASILIVTPILFPISQTLGINPIHFGIIITMVMSLGMSTPPVGENLYIVSSIAKISFESICKQIWPFIIMAIIACLLVAYIPGISMFLPNLFY